MTNLETIAYTEVFEILSYMNKETVKKIPVQILEYIKNNRNENYISKIDKNDIFNKNNIVKETQVILAYLDLKYFCSEESREVKFKIYKENEEKYKNEVKNNNDKIDVFKIEKIDVTDNVSTEIIKHKENFIIRFFNFIKRIFKK